MVPVTVVLLGWTATRAAGEELGVGDAAPKLAVKEFVKGDPVKALEKGKTYVVEFWATWCGPCRVSIPHLTDLQKKYKDVTFIGVSVWEREPKGVEPFVKEMGDKMDYRVALDEVAAGEKPDEGTMARTWMTAAGQNGIPTAFIVNGEGKIAWIGHPMEMDKPLEKIAAGKWDLALASREYREKAVLARKARELQQKLVQAQKSGDRKELLAVLDQAIADDPKMEKQFGSLKLRTLAANADDADKTAAYARHLMEKIYPDNAQGLNFVAWTIVDPDAKTKPDGKLIKVALEAAKKADELAEGKDGAIADTLAKAYFDSGDTVKALQTQERAVKLVEGTRQGNDPGIKARLEQYRKAAKKE
jgi:thiol-disulfide isomerase/thioredoxin